MIITKEMADERYNRLKRSESLEDLRCVVDCAMIHARKNNFLKARCDVFKNLKKIGRNLDSLQEIIFNMAKFQSSEEFYCFLLTHSIFD